MNTGKVYHDSEGNERSIHQMVKSEPHWAANRIQAGEDAIKELVDVKKRLEAAERVIVRFRCAFIAEDIMEMNEAFVDSSELFPTTQEIKTDE
jgi:hypothetical protein